MKAYTTRRIRRGDVFVADLDPVIGSEQGGTRPVVILQNDAGNRYSPTVIAAPFTSEIKKQDLPTHVCITKCGCLEVDSMAMLEQIRVLDKRHLKEFLGFIRRADVERLDEALRISLGLDEVMELCLCPTCADTFYRYPGRYRITRVNMKQLKTDSCCMCQVRKGYDFRIITHKARH